MIWIPIGALVLLAAGTAFWWIRRRRTRLISFVALLREPVSFDPAVLAAVAGKAWGADLGDGGSPGKDGFVCGTGRFTTVMHDGRAVLINSVPEPYTPDVETAAATIADLRIRGLLLEHRAWFSCDALGVDGTTPAAEIREWRRRLAILFAELIDENCLLIYLPDPSRAYPINDDTERALRSADPVQALQETCALPLLAIAEDDPLLKQAVSEARGLWPNFVTAFEARAGEHFSAKAPITRAGNTEFIWLSVTSIEGGLIYGELDNEPANLGSLKLGSKVSVPAADLTDWCYVDPKGMFIGGFTIEAVKKAQRRRG